MTSTKEKCNTLLIVDVQKDFHGGGSLAIPGADEDAERLASFIGKHSSAIHRIVATMDTHPVLHIAHGGFWVHSETGEHPPPFTILSAADVAAGVWKPRPNLYVPPDSLDPSIFQTEASVIDPATGSILLEKYCIEYTRRLEAAGRFQLCIWPEHCLIGSPGHGIQAKVYEALKAWSQLTGRDVEYVMKGQNMLTEMYSVMQAEVPVTAATTFNQELQDSFATSTTLVVSGQASSHCVNYSLRDIVVKRGGGKDVILLTDTASAVPGFEAAGDAFFLDMKNAGVSLKPSTEIDSL